MVPSRCVLSLTRRLICAQATEDVTMQRCIDDEGCDTSEEIAEAYIAEVKEQLPDGAVITEIAGGNHESGAERASTRRGGQDSLGDAAAAEEARSRRRHGRGWDSLKPPPRPRMGLPRDATAAAEEARSRRRRGRGGKSLATPRRPWIVRAASPSAQAVRQLRVAGLLEGPRLQGPHRKDISGGPVRGRRGGHRGDGDERLKTSACGKLMCNHHDVVYYVIITAARTTRPRLSPAKTPSRLCGPRAAPRGAASRATLYGAPPSRAAGPCSNRRAPAARAAARSCL